MAEEPPYLSVDTDVSAKYKGAFCEAKIRKVVRSVKCKVLFKQGWGSATVPDDQIKGTLRIGAVVEAKHPDKKEFAEGTITKIQDCSQYTVVFDDGDITTLRRTALCLKSGRHFAESDTLDQLPLTHPEHFSNPVIGGRRGRRRLDENSEDEELLLISGGDLEDEREEHIGRVVCVEGSEKKKQKDNWFPGLVVAPTAQDNVPIHVKEEYLVRSFKDGRYYTVPKKEANEFTREMGSKVENLTLKAAVDKALLYLDRDELPPHWDRDLLLYGLAEVTTTDNDGGMDYESSDDEPREEKDHFVAQLYKFMDDSGTPINKGPTIGTRDVDLYKLFKVVQNQGGYNRVTNHNNWKLVAQKIGFGQNPITVNLVKIAYKKFLFTFEEFYRKLGCTLLNHASRLSRSCCRGGRNLIRNKDQTVQASNTTVKTETKPRQVKDGKVIQNDLMPISKIKIEKLDDYMLNPQEFETDDEIPVDAPKSPSPSCSKSKKAPNSPPLPVKVKIEPGTDNPLQSTLNETVVEENTNSSLAEPITQVPPSSVVQSNLEQTNQGQITTSFPNVTQPPAVTKIQPVQPQIQKKEARARQLKKIQSTNPETVQPSEGMNTNDSVTIVSPSMAQIKEKKRRAAFPRAVVAAKKIKHQARSNSPRPPGLAASRAKRTVNKEKLRTIVKNLKSKWVPSTVTPSTSGQDQPTAKAAVKSKATKDETPSNADKKKKDEIQTQNGATSEDKKKSGRKRRDKRHSEDRFVPLPSYKTILLGDKLRVYYGPTLESKVTYEAKVLSIRTEGTESVYLVHYTGWNNRYDEWIQTSRIADNLSWIPGRSARKTNQTPKTPKKKGGHCKTESANVTTAKDASSASLVIQTSNNTVTNKTTNQPSTSRKASTRASTRAAAIKKEVSSSSDVMPQYDCDGSSMEAIITKKESDTEHTKSNDACDKKIRKQKKLSDDVNNGNDENDDYENDDEDEDEEDDVDIDDYSNHGSTSQDIKPIKSELVVKEEQEESDISNNQLNNVIIVDVELKNESEEEAMMIDDNQEIDEGEVIEGYSTVVESAGNREGSYKILASQTGREFDLSQIRSELKGIDTSVSRTEEVDEGELTNTVDIYEFKEPEFETSSPDDKVKQRGLMVRMFSDISRTKGIQDIEDLDESKTELDGANTSTELSSSQDDKPILKTCEEAFDRVCAEPLREATERPPAGFLFMGDDDEDDIYGDDDSQDRLIISERDSDNEFQNDMSVNLASNVRGQISLQPTEKLNTSDNGESTKEVLLSKDDDEEDLEDVLLNVAIQRAIESSDDTNDGDLLSRHLAPRRIFSNNFVPVLEVENDENNAVALKTGNLNVTEETTITTEENSKEIEQILQNSALDLSQGTEDIQDREEVITNVDEGANQENTEPDIAMETVDSESNIGEPEIVDELEDDGLIPLDECPPSPGTTIVSSGRGPHTPPGPGPRTPPEPGPQDEYNETFDETYEEVDSDEVWSNFENKDDSNVLETNQMERDEQPPLLTREVEVEDCEDRNDDIDGNDDDNDESNLVSLLCEETIPGSPTAPVQSDNFQMSPEVQEPGDFHYSASVAVSVSKVEAIDSIEDDKLQEMDSKSIVEETIENSPTSQIDNLNSTIFRNIPRTSRTPIPSPTSSLSSVASPPRERIESPHQDVMQVEEPVIACQNDVFEAGCSSQVINQDETSKPQTSESLRTRKSESRNSGKKTRRSRKRSEDTNKRKNRSRQHGSDSDDMCESSSRGYQRRSRTPPRLRKYNFSVQLSPELDHQHRVNKILNALTDVRKAHANVKIELASIERRRKKLRRREREFRI